MSSRSIMSSPSRSPRPSADAAVGPAPGQAATVEPPSTASSTEEPTRPLPATPTTPPAMPGASRPTVGAAAIGTITKPTSIRPALSPLGKPEGFHRPTPFESGLAAVARHDVHIERVWPMRSPSTGTLGESSSASSQGDRRGTPPASIVPVEGLRMSQEPSSPPTLTRGLLGAGLPPPAGHGHRGGRSVRPGATGSGGRRHPRRGRTCRGPARGPSRTSASSASTAIRWPWPRPPRRWPPSAAGPPSVSPGSTRSVRSSGRRSAASDRSTGQRLSGVLFDLGVSSPQLDVAERGLLLPARRLLGHEDGPDLRPHRRRRGQRVRRGRPGGDLRRQRRGSVRPAHRPGHRGRPAPDHHRPAGRRGA